MNKKGDLKFTNVNFKVVFFCRALEYIEKPKVFQCPPSALLGCSSYLERRVCAEMRSFCALGVNLCAERGKECALQQLF